MKKQAKNDPFEYMIMNRDEILQALERNSTILKAWKSLTETMPEIEDVIKFNTFKVYARILVKFGKVMDEKEKESARVRQSTVLLEKTEAMHQDPESAPKRINGWGVQLNRGYFRLFKKISGKVRWIYIGKVWNQDDAEEKIKQFESDNNG